jgi:hypothetical protein
MLATTLAGAVGAALCIHTSHALARDRPGSRPESSGPVTPSDDGGTAGGFPDVIVSSMASEMTNYAPVGTVGAFSMRSVSCNIGTTDAIWFAGSANHPVIPQNFYRLKGGRFEQIGMSWLKHGFCAADAPSCPGGTYAGNGSCDWLGLFATDTYISSRNGTQVYLGPRSEVNAWTGAYPYPYILNWNTTGSSIFKRLQFNVADVDPSLNAGALYYGEVQYVCTDELPAQRYNNVSYKQLLVGTPIGVSWNIVPTGGTITQQPAINAWRAVDPSVVLTNIDVPNDGRLILGSKVTDLGGGQWSYEYALYNMNCDRGVQSFGIPFESSVGIANIGFHDTFYHSGEAYSSVDWATSVGVNGVMSWETQSYASNPNANALRWSTLYNFRFTAAAPPRCTTATIGLFKPGATPSVTVMVPGPAGCLGDIAPVGLGNGSVDVNDLLEIITRWGPCTPSTTTCGCAADVAPDGGNDTVDVNDLLKVISTWGACP